MHTPSNSNEILMHAVNSKYSKTRYVAANTKQGLFDGKTTEITVSVFFISSIQIFAFDRQKALFLIFVYLTQFFSDCWNLSYLCCISRILIAGDDGRVRVEVQEIGTPNDRKYICAAYSKCN